MDLATLFGLAGKRALVTGGTSGIGLAVSEALARAGASVVAASDREADCEAARERLSGEGLLVDTVCLRLSGKESAERLAAAARERLGGPVDFLVANAGIEGPVGPTGAAREADYLAAFDVNLHSADRLAAAVAPDMREAGGGSIALMASLSAMRGNRAIGPYAMTKAALTQMARNLAVELGPRNIRANAVAPGLIETPFARGLMSDPAFMARRLASTPLSGASASPQKSRRRCSCWSRPAAPSSPARPSSSTGERSSATEAERSAPWRLACAAVWLFVAQRSHRRDHGGERDRGAFADASILAKSSESSASPSPRLDLRHTLDWGWKNEARRPGHVWVASAAQWGTNCRGICRVN